MFYKDVSELPSNFISLYAHPTYFENIKLKDGALVSCVYDGSSLKLRENEEDVGYFYDWYVFTEGIKEALSDDRFAIIIANDKKKKRKVSSHRNNMILYPVKISYFIKRESILSMFNQEKIPKMVSTLYKLEGEQFNKKELNCSSLKSTSLDYTTYSIPSNKNFKLFTHQENNIKWMLKLTNSILYNQNRIDMYENIKTKTFPIGKDLRICFTKEGQIIKAEDLKKITAFCKGGFICDLIGVGKTLCAIQLAKIMDRSTLIVLPPKLVIQWEEEFKKFGYKSPEKIVCLRSCKKFIKKWEIKPGKEKPSIICLVNSRFLSTYHEQYKDLLSNWDITIIDEAHEIASVKKNLEIFSLRTAVSYICKTSKCCWFLTATPFCFGENSFKYIISLILETDYKLNLEKSWNPLSNIYFGKHHKKYIEEKRPHAELLIEVKNKFNILQHNNTWIEQLINKFIRRNKSKDVTSLDIPKPTWNNIFLDLSIIEKTLYDGEKGNLEKGNFEKMIQLCSHPICSKFYQKIANSNEFVPLNQFINLSLKYLYSRIPRITTKIETKNKIYINNFQMNCEDKLNNQIIFKEIQEEILFLEEELTECKYRKKVIEESLQQLDKNDCCVCMEKMKKAILPSCSHPVCFNCFGQMNKCPLCRLQYDKKNVKRLDCINKNKNEEKRNF